MRNITRHIYCFLGMAAMLLCMAVCRVDAAVADGTPVQTSAAVGSVHEECDVACASLSEKEDDMLRAVREMGQWGIPSASVTLQGTTGRVLTLSEVLERIGRMTSALFAGELPCGNGLTEVLHHTLLTKRFHSGYYIYYRCQMRC